MMVDLIYVDQIARIDAPIFRITRIPAS